MEARYANGRAAVTHHASCELGQTGLTIRVGDATHAWPYADLRRADDGAGRIILKRKPDTGERLYLELGGEHALRAVAPKLFARSALGIEGPGVIVGVTAAAWSLAAVFLMGVPLAAAPIADNIPPRYREQIAEISWSQVGAITAPCDDADEAERILNDVAYRMMSAADVPMRDAIWVSVVDAPFPNAFALPDHAIIVTDDLIAMADHPDELVGVIAHEIAHIERNHIMKNIIRSVGAGIFFDVVFGGAGAGQMIAIASVNLSSLRFSRDDETDADTRGLDFLDAANINTGGLAQFFERISEENLDGGIPTMLSSHPASPARAAAARARARDGLAPSISPADWQIVRRACEGSAGFLDDQDEAAEAARDPASGMQKPAEASTP